MSKQLLIDGSNLARRCFAVVPPLTSPDGQPSQVVFEVLRMVKGLVEQFRPDHVIVAWDEGIAARRKIYPLQTLPSGEVIGYKAGRRKAWTPQQHAEMADTYQPQVLALKEMLPHFGIHQYSVPGAEADDIISILSTTGKERHSIMLLEDKHSIIFEDKHSIILSEDKDFIQLVSPNTHLYRPICKKMYTEENFEEMVGLRTPLQYLNARVLIGDSSDEIPGVPGIGEKTAFELMKKYGSIQEMLRYPLSLQTSKRTAVIPDHLDTISRNFRLMDLAFHSSIYITPEEMHKGFIFGTYDNEMAWMHCNYYGFNSLLNSAFFHPFTTFRRAVSPFSKGAS